MVKVCARASAHGLAWEACAPQGLHLPIDWREEKGAVLSIIRKVGEVHGVYCLGHAESADNALNLKGVGALQHNLRPISRPSLSLHLRFAL